MSGLPARLSPREERYVQAYCTSARFVGAVAAREAGYSPKAARQAALRLARRPHVQEAIRRYLEEHSLNAPQVLARLSDQALASMADFLDERGEVDLAKAERLGKLHLVKAVRYSRTGKPEIELHDSTRALELLGKALSLFSEQHHVTLHEPFKVYHFDPEQVQDVEHTVEEVPALEAGE